MIILRGDIKIWKVCLKFMGLELHHGTALLIYFKVKGVKYRVLTINH